MKLVFNNKIYSAPLTMLKPSSIVPSFFEFISGPACVKKKKKQVFCVFIEFSLTIFMFLPNRITSLVQTTSWSVPLIVPPFWFSWTFSVTYCTVQLKSSSHRAHPCFRPFWTGNLSHKCVSIWTSLHISLRHFHLPI